MKGKRRVEISMSLQLCDLLKQHADLFGGTVAGAARYYMTRGMEHAIQGKILQLKRGRSK